MNRVFDEVESDLKAKLRDQEVRYLAGFFDGEGSVGIAGSSLSVRVVNSYRPVLERFVACFGGTIGMHNKGGEKNRMTWVWRVYGEHAADALNCLLPHLQEKRAQSYLGLHFRHIHKADKVARECTVEALSLLKKVTHHA